MYAAQAWMPWTAPSNRPLTGPVVLDTLPMTTCEDVSPTSVDVALHPPDAPFVLPLPAVPCDPWLPCVPFFPFVPPTTTPPGPAVGTLPVGPGRPVFVVPVPPPL